MNRTSLTLSALAAAVVVGLGLSGPAAAQDTPLPADSITVVMTDIEPFVVRDNGRADGFYATTT
jgi:ABC-type sugar transport system substrate-binding protein